MGEKLNIMFGKVSRSKPRSIKLVLLNALNKQPRWCLRKELMKCLKYAQNIPFQALHIESLYSTLLFYPFLAGVNAKLLKYVYRPAGETAKDNTVSHLLQPIHNLSMHAMPR